MMDEINEEGKMWQRGGDVLVCVAQDNIPLSLPLCVASGLLGRSYLCTTLDTGKGVDSGAGGIDSQVVLNREVGSGKMCLSVFKSMNTRIP